jgi:ureidoglycolate lyase
MKLFRHGPRGEERPGVVDPAGGHRDLGGVIDDLAGEVLTPAGLARLRAIDPSSLPLLPAPFRFGACVGAVPKFICIGLNYADHAAETGATPPREPILFMKGVNAICGPDDDLEIPRGSTKTDWEVELGVVIGRPAKYVAEADALDHVAGYCVVHDVSERAFQMEREGQWTKGKSHDTFGPIGPYLVTADAVPDPHNLSLWLEVDGHRHQNGNTKTMIFKTAALVSYISQFMTLQTGDVISTGTPPGVGMGHKPSPIFLRPGQTVRLGVEGLGEQTQRTVQA